MTSLSIFGTDHVQPAQASPLREGLVFSTEAIALTAALARHFDLGFEDVEEMLSPVLPHSIPSLCTPAGWALFGQYVANGLAVPPPPFKPTLH